MIRSCPKCGKINNSDSLWCINCNSKLYKTINEPLNPSNTNEDEIFTKKIKPSTENNRKLPSLKIFLITSITIGLILLIIISLSFYFHHCPKDSLFDQLGEDFYYSEGKIVTAEGVVYNISDVKDYKLNGKIQNVLITDYINCNPSPFEFLTNLLGNSDSSQYNCSLTTINDNQRIDIQIVCNSTEENMSHENHLTENKLIFLNPEDKLQLNSDIDIDDDIIIEGAIANIEESQINNQGDITNLECSTEVQTNTSQVVIVEKVIVKKSDN